MPCEEVLQRESQRREPSPERFAGELRIAGAAPLLEDLLHDPLVCDAGAARLPAPLYEAPEVAQQVGRPARLALPEGVRPAQTFDARLGLARRQAEHARDPALKDFEFEPAHRTDNYAAQRGLEQMLRDQYNAPYDKINAISPSNPRRAEYMEAARRFLSGGQR